MSAAAFNLALFLDRLTVVTPPCLYAFGCVLLAGKLFALPALQDAGRLAWYAVGAWALLLAVDAVRGGRRPYSREYAAAWLDLRNRAGGRIIAGAEGVVPEIVARPSVLPFLRSLLLPLPFLVAALLVPARQPGKRLSAASLENRLDRLEREIEERRERIAEPDVENLLRQIEEIREITRSDPESAAEAAASMADRLDEAEASRYHRMAEALERAADLWRETAAAGSAGLEGGESAARVAELRRSLDELVRKEGGIENMPEDFREAWEQGMGGEAPARPGSEAAHVSGTGGNAGAGARAGGGMTGEQLERMLRALENMADGMTSGGGAGESAGRGGNGEDGGNPGGSGGESGEGEGAGSGSGAAAAASRLGSVSQELARMRQQLGEAAMGAPGAGGVDRGRGDAPLFFGNPSERGDLGVEYIPMPRSGKGEEGILLKRERVAPGDEPPEEFRAPWRSAADVPEEIRAGRAPSGLGPERERAARRYFEALGQP